MQQSISNVQYLSASAKSLSQHNYEISVMDLATGSYEVHSHNQFEVLIVLAGQRVHHIGEYDISAKEGDIIFVPPNLNHGATIKSPSRSLVLKFDLLFLHPELPTEATSAWANQATLAIVPALLPFLTQQNKSFKSKGQLIRKLLGLAGDLKAGQARGELGTEMRARAGISLWLLDVLHRFYDDIETSMRDFSPEAKNTVIERLGEFIKDNLSNKVSIGDAAEVLHISSSCLAARIKRTTGQTFGDLVSLARLTRAKELLAYSDLRISDVAYDCGFEDHAYFSRRFRQKFGISPSAYRLSLVDPQSNEISALSA